MKKSFSQLKRDLSIGDKLKCLEHNIRPERVGQVNEIVRKNGNALTTLQDSKEVWLNYPASANLVEYEDNTFAFYEAGWRNITEEEKKHFEAMHEYEQAHIWENTYWPKKSYFERNGVPYLMGCGVEKGKRFDRNKYKQGDMCCIQDNSIQGELLYSFEIIK